MIAISLLKFRSDYCREHIDDDTIMRRGVRGVFVCRLGLVDGSDALCRHPAAVPDEHRRCDVSVRVRQPDCGAVRVDEA